MSPVIRSLISAVYYCIPNFAAFDFKVQAVYALAVPLQGLMFTGLYFLLYTGLVLLVAVWAFNRRELA
jgi:hypothetical protein